MFTQDYFLQMVSVKGEVSNCKYHPSGHIYFTLKDSASALNCIMFAGDRRGLGFRLTEGQQVIAKGSVSVFERDGRYQLYVKEVTLDGAGALYEKYEQLKRELAEEGMFAPEYKQQIPKYIHTLGVVTADTGAAVRDIIQIATRRNPYVQIILYPALVQGASAAPSIVNGIRALERQGVDVMIVGRGGGSIEDLWAFNDERVARAIYESEIPVISAVGHEPDVTIADYVADARASTPSNAAEIAVPDRNDVRARLMALERSMTKTEESRLTALRERLTALERKRVLRDPMAFIADKRLLLDYTQKNLASLAEKQVGERRQRFAALCASLHAMSPLAVLARGYAVARTANGTVLRSADEVTVGETIDVTLGRGSLACTVNETRGENSHGKKL